MLCALSLAHMAPARQREVNSVEFRFWDIADMVNALSDARFWGIKQTSGEGTSMSAYDPKRTSTLAIGRQPLFFVLRAGLIA
jgi:hypothetical protein